MQLTMITTFLEEQLEVKRVGQVYIAGQEICKRSNTLHNECNFLAYFLLFDSPCLRIDLFKEVWFRQD